jgi:threonine aldolase
MMKNSEPMIHSPRGFASDNNAGVHPTILEAMAAVNKGHVVGYGDDPYTRRTMAMMQELFGPDSEIFFVFTGTAANVLGLSAAAAPFHAVLCPETAHINVDECGAPEKFTGCKLIDLPTDNGKIYPDQLKESLHFQGVEHHVQPRVVSITQATEMGTLYSADEISDLAEFAHGHGLFLHMDGARIANAAAAMDLDFYGISGALGVDILSFGGTKNGMMFGEAVVFFKRELAEGFKYRRKQGMQLASKMRYMSAQFEAYLDGELWRENARHANAMARKLFEAVRHIPGVEVTQEVQSNGVFAIVPREIIAPLQDAYFFYVWDEGRSEVRWMCSFDTTEEDIDGFTATLRNLLGSR